ncbi:MAG: hypothetical protein R2861_03005 [Desulfobacterales bacterium]
MSRDMAVGTPAHLTVIDPEKPFTYDAEKDFQKPNTPFQGWELRGRAVYTIVDGQVVFECQ